MTDILSVFQGSLVQVACHKNGSRSLESMWKSVNLKLRTSIARELSQHSDRLKSDMIGRHIERKFALRHFNTRNSDWTTLQKSDNKKRALFTDVLAATGGQGSGWQP